MTATVAAAAADDGVAGADVDGAEVGRVPAALDGHRRRRHHLSDRSECCCLSALCSSSAIRGVN